MGESTYRTHADRHPEYVEGCLPCKWNTLVMGKGDLSPDVLDARKRDAQLVKDREAYKRMRDDGVQPNQVGGSARLEQSAVEQIDIDMKVPIPKEHRDQVKEIVAEIAVNDFAKGTR